MMSLGALIEEYYVGLAVADSRIMPAINPDLNASRTVMEENG